MLRDDLDGLTQKGRELLRLIGKRGLTITRHGHAFRVTGPGVDIAVARLELLRPNDLMPHLSGEHSGQAARHIDSA